ncbi:MAG: hypothetical protein Q7R83_00435 [bacterium]|nr:hypothetical protein [bacterium]
MPDETAKNEILEAIHAFAESVDERFNKIDERFNKVDERFNKMESAMVTKDFFSEKMADLRGDLVILVRKEDKKVAALVEELLVRKVLDRDAANRILALEPFASN